MLKKFIEKHISAIQTLAEYLTLWIIGGSCYFMIEILWRGYSHWTMFILGGGCFVAIGLINQFYLTWNMNLLYQMLISSVIITVLEFIAGCILNIWLGWGIWDYSNLPFNILGQVCLLYMVLWFFLSLVAIIADDLIRYTLFKEDKPHYYIKR